MLKVVRNGCIR